MSKGTGYYLEPAGDHSTNPFRQLPCHECNGWGVRRCPGCKNHYLLTPNNCATCKGTQKVPCPACGGSGVQVWE